MIRRPEIPYLVAAVLLAAAACILIGLHDTLPSFLPLAVVGLLSAGAGISLPGALPVPAAAAAPEPGRAAELVPAVPAARVEPAAAPVDARATF